MKNFHNIEWSTVPAGAGAEAEDSECSISWEELNARFRADEREKKLWQLVDIRGAQAQSYGVIPRAVKLSAAAIEDALESGDVSAALAALGLDTARPCLLYCGRGQLSAELAPALRAQGVPAFSLSGGYAAWVMSVLEEESAAGATAETQGAQPGVGKAEEVAKAIRKKFHKRLFSPFARAIRDYQLLQSGDRIAVCISGGKDSMLMAKLFQELKQHNKFPFELVFLVMDPGYSPFNRALIEKNAALLGIPIQVFESNIFDTVYEVEQSPCYLCARMRRGHLYSQAKALGCNKIALGHHYDDVIETILMGMLYGAQIQTMMPKLHSSNFEGMELIRPMYYVREADIKHWRDYHQLHFLQCACRFTDTCSTVREDGSTDSKRMEIKQLIARLKESNPYVEANIFKSVENVSLDAVIAYKHKGERHHFTETY